MTTNNNLAESRLRDYQREAVNRCLLELDSESGVLLVSPTGAGKTVMAAEIARHYNSVLFVAHRFEIVKQARAEMGANVHAMTIGSVNRYGPNGADLLIIDEAHHSAAKTYRGIIERYPAARRLGLTATPLRTDGKSLSGAFSSIVEVSDMRSLVAAGHLVPYRAFEAPDEALEELKRIRKRGADFATGELSELMNRPRLVGNAVNEYRKHASGRRAIAFAVSVEHSLALTEAFRNAGIRAAHLDGRASDRLRAESLQKLASGEIEVLCNVNLFTEGWDCPPVSCVIMARPTLSLTLYLQCVGRGMRMCDGKDDVIIFDHAGNIERHGLPDAYRNWSLESSRKRAAEIKELERIYALGFESLEEYQLEQKRISEQTVGTTEAWLIVQRQLACKSFSSFLRLSRIAPVIGKTNDRRYWRHEIEAAVEGLMETISASEATDIINKATGRKHANSFLRNLGIRPIAGSGSLTRYAHLEIERVTELFSVSCSMSDAVKMSGLSRHTLATLFAGSGVEPCLFEKAGRGGKPRYLKSDVRRVAVEAAKYISLADAAKVLKCSKENAYSLLNERGLDVIRGRGLDGRLGYLAEAVNALAEQRDLTGLVSKKDAAVIIGSDPHRVGGVLERIGIRPVRRWGRVEFYLASDIERAKSLKADSYSVAEAREKIGIERSKFYDLMKSSGITACWPAGPSSRYSRSAIDQIAMKYRSSR